MISDAAWLNFLRSTSLICNGIILVIALAFLLGPKTLTAISKFFDKYHTTIALDKLLLTKVRITLGLILLVIALLMLVSTINIKI